MANNVTFIFQAIDRYTTIAGNIARATMAITRATRNATRSSQQFSNTLRTTATTMTASAHGYLSSVNAMIMANQQLVQSIGQVHTAQQQTNNSTNQTSSSLLRLGRQTASVGNELMAKLTLPIVALGTVSVMNAAKLESLGISFEVMTGSAAKGTKLFKEMTAFAATTPFKVDEVMDATKMLLSYTIQAEDMNDTMRMLGDLAAGTGKPIKEFALVFGQVKAKGRLMGQEVLQMAEKGIAVSAVLAKMSGKSQLEITKMIEKGQVSFKDFEKALKHLTTKGGTFFELTHRLSKSTAGLFAQLHGEITLTTAAIGKFIIQEFNINKGTAGITANMKAFREGFDDFRKNHPIIAKIVLFFALFLAVLGPIVAVIGQIMIAMAALTIVMGFFGITTWAALWPILLIIAAIALVITILVLLWLNWEKLWTGAKELALEFLEELKAIGTRIKDFFIMLGAELFQFLVNPLQFFKDIFNWVSSKIKSLGSSAAAETIKIKEIAEMSGKIDVVGSSKTQVDINFNDPGKMVQDTKTTTQTSGTTAPMNIGVYNTG